MIRLRDLLREVEYGQKLWADPAFASSSAEYRRFLDRIYKGELEKDTEQELAVFMALKKYLQLNEKDRIDSKMIADLMALRYKFPGILDPESAEQRVDEVYRGMTVSIEALPGLIERAARVSRVGTWIAGGEWIRLVAVDTDIESRSEGGFLSFATDLRSAAGFSGGRAPAGRWPVVTSTPYAKVAKAALWNPDWLTMVGGYEESEIWLIGQRFPVQDLYIYHPAEMGTRLPRETDTVTDALTRRGVKL
ncbi:MAG: hypothetical protein ACO3K3_04275 [Schleiferiaceae bacterium]